jgi:hypothetical protein
MLYDFRLETGNTHQDQTSLRAGYRFLRITWTRSSPVKLGLLFVPFSSDSSMPFINAMSFSFMTSQYIVHLERHFLNNVYSITV